MEIQGKIDTKWIYSFKDWGGSYEEKDEGEFLEMVWSCAKESK